MALKSNIIAQVRVLHTITYLPDGFLTLGSRNYSTPYDLPTYQLVVTSEVYCFVPA